MRLRIVEDRETLDIDTRGNLVRYRRIEFMLDDKGPYVYQTPAEAFSIEAFKEYVREIANQIKAMEGLEF